MAAQARAETSRNGDCSLKTKRRKREKHRVTESAQIRHARELPLQADTAALEIEDPQAEKPSPRITVLRQLRGDPLARLHTRRQIDEAQYNAGRAFQRDWETAERGVRGIDPTREHVDGRAPPAAVTDKTLRARERLVALERVLGRTMHSVTRAVLVDGMTMETTAARLFNREGETAAKYCGQLFRDALDVLAVEYRLASAARREARSRP